MASPYNPLDFGFGGLNLSNNSTTDMLANYQLANTGMGQAGSTSPGFWSMDSFIGNGSQPGWGNLALGAASGLMNGFMAMKQYGLAKDALSAQREAFEKNYEAQRQSTNTQLEDRQRARVASNPSAYESVSSYMDRNRIV